MGASGHSGIWPVCENCTTHLELRPGGKWVCPTCNVETEPVFGPHAAKQAASAKVRNAKAKAKGKSTGA